MFNPKIDRRELIRRGLIGTIGGSFALEQLAGIPGLFNWTSRHLINPALVSLDAYHLIPDALRGGVSALRLHQAMAADTNDYVLVTIKVCNHVHTPLVFRLGELQNGTVTTEGVQLVSSRAGQAQTSLINQGVDKISDQERYQRLRFNKWFADILHNGTADGQAPASRNLLGLQSTDVAPFPQSVALQAFLHVDKINTQNHALKGCKLRSDLPDLALFARDQAIIDSPLGISCFMMGGEYDKAEGGMPKNAVLGASESETEVIASRTVSSYVDQIKQFVGNTYADRSRIEQNLTYQLDQLVDKKPRLRRELINSVNQFKKSLDALEDSAGLESFQQVLDRSLGNGQSASASAMNGSRSEFLAQCQYVSRSLDLPGMPLRNFSLFLNIVDLDGKDLDDARNLVSPGQTEDAIRAYSYVEGMRQLAMGLNVLAKTIAAGKKMVVVVLSEGGRGAGMEDSNTCFNIVMGPRGPGKLDDCLYADLGAINQRKNSVLDDPAAAGSAIPWTVDGLREANGAAVTNQKVNMGDVQLGVIEFLEEQTGVTARSGLTGARGRYVKLKRYESA